MSVHPTAIVSPDAHLDTGVSVGPFAIINAGAVIGREVAIGAYATVYGSARLGEQVTIGSHALIGLDPESLTFDARQPTELTIATGTTILERVNVARSTGPEPTRIGRDCYVMSNAHIGHDCQIGDSVTIGHDSGLAGHVRVDNDVVLGAKAGVHQWVRIGQLAMIGAMTAAMQDVLPFHMAAGIPARQWQLNTVGLRRHNVTAAEFGALRRMFVALQRHDTPEPPSTPHTEAVHQFLSEPSKRGTAPFARQRKED